jgi:hypothetical protein
MQQERRIFCWREEWFWLSQNDTMDPIFAPIDLWISKHIQGPDNLIATHIQIMSTGRLWRRWRRNSKTPYPYVFLNLRVSISMRGNRTYAYRFLSRTSKHIKNIRQIGGNDINACGMQTIQHYLGEHDRGNRKLRHKSINKPYLDFSAEDRLSLSAEWWRVLIWLWWSLRLWRMGETSGTFWEPAGYQNHPFPRRAYGLTLASERAGGQGTEGRIWTRSI